LTAIRHQERESFGQRDLADVPPRPFLEQKTRRIADDEPVHLFASLAGGQKQVQADFVGFLKITQIMEIVVLYFSHSPLVAVNAGEEPLVFQDLIELKKLTRPAQPKGKSLNYLVFAFL